MQKVFVTGVGTINAAGSNFHEFWRNIILNKNCISCLNIANPKLSSYWGGKIGYISPEKYFSRRLLNKCSRFSKLALLAVNEAIKHAELDISKLDMRRVGIFVGNNSGGWEKAREGLKTLHSEGVEYVSPYLASNWFPAAPQGHISLVYGIKGYSKTVIADRASSLLAISHAAKKIFNGDLDVAIVGGTETPLDEWALTFYQSFEERLNFGSSTKYNPFDMTRNGMILGEGAAFLILESAENLHKREALQKRIAEVKGFGFSSPGKFDVNFSYAVKQCARAMQKACDESGIAPSEIDLISLDGAANAFDDAVEIYAIQNIFGDNATKAYAFCPKTFFGNTIGASGAFDLILSIAAMQNSIIPCLAHLKNVDPSCKLNFVINKNRKVAINSSMVISRGIGHVSSVMIITK